MARLVPKLSKTCYTLRREAIDDRSGRHGLFCWTRPAPIMFAVPPAPLRLIGPVAMPWPSILTGSVVSPPQGGGGGHTGNEDRPLHLPIHQSLRCGARTRTGSPCRSPAVSGRQRCRMHGGAKGNGAPAGNCNALKHGRYSREAIEFRRRMQELVREARELIEIT